MRVAIIANAGAGSAGEKDEEVRFWDSAISRSGLDAKAFLVPGPELLDTARRLADSGDYDVIAASGGDGTLSAVAGALTGRTDVVMGLLPRGTLNHFSKDLNIPQEIDESLPILQTGIVKSVDVATLNDRVFINNSSVGMYSQAVADRDRALEEGGNKWVEMTRAMLKQWWQFRVYRLRIECGGFEGSRKTPLLFVGNNRYELAFPKPGTRNSLEDGILCLYIPRTTSRWGLFRLSIRAWLGFAFRDRDFDTIDTHKITIRSKKVRLTVSVDGEVASFALPLKYSIQPKALRVMVPAPTADAE